MACVYCNLYEETWSKTLSSGMTGKKAKVGKDYTNNIINKTKKYMGIIQPAETFACHGTSHNLTPFNEIYLLSLQCEKKEGQARTLCLSHMDLSQKLSFFYIRLVQEEVFLQGHISEAKSCTVRQVPAGQCDKINIVSIFDQLFPGSTKFPSLTKIK
jgi:hypothetical protein